MKIGEWLQIDFVDRVAVTRVATQGNSPAGDHNNWVTSYKLSFSKDNVSWEFFKENGQEKVRNLQAYFLGIREAVLL